MSKITFDEFQAHLQAGYPYTGLVDGVGYVYWIPHTVYFYKDYPQANGSYVKNRFGRPVLKQIPEIMIFEYKRKRYEIVTKTQYDIRVIPPEELFRLSPQIYQEYYEGKMPPVYGWENGVYINKNDAIQPPKNTYRDINSVENQAGRLGLKEDMTAFLRTAEKIDDAIGLPLGVVDEFNGLKKIPYAGKILTGLSILSDINDGEYISAAGKVITAAAGVYGVAWDVVSWMYNTDYMQEGLARLNATDAKKYLFDYYQYKKLFEDDQKRGKYNDYYKKKMDESFEKYKSYNNMFKKNLDNLKIKYNE
jgi:hypothetical protein